MTENSAKVASLLSINDPAPVEWVSPDSTVPVLLVCEHAGQALPEALGNMGLPAGAIDGHIGWDIGAAELALAVAKRLNAPLILQRYSRLVIDCNRPPCSDGAIPKFSDKRPIPGNQNLTEAQKTARRDEVFAPFNRAIELGFDLAPRVAAFSIHSYTPALEGGARRPWHAGFLTRKDTATAGLMLDHIAQSVPDLSLAVNQPYLVDDETDWFLPVHAETRKLRHTLIEVRNDLIVHPEGIAHWAKLLAGAISEVLESTK